jgi:hypothetical protein
LNESTPSSVKASSPRKKAKSRSPSVSKSPKRVHIRKDANVSNGNLDEEDDDGEVEFSKLKRSNKSFNSTSFDNHFELSKSENLTESRLEKENEL